VKEGESDSPIIILYEKEKRVRSFASVVHPVTDTPIFFKYRVSQNWLPREKREP
jgi:hypothetical protein